MLQLNRSHLFFTVVFGVGIFVFFYGFFPHHLHYREQFQLFLFTKSYFLETCSRPGGFANYLGRFFTQFYLFAGLGALIVSLMLVGIQQLIYAFGRRIKETSAGWFLSFLPALFYWYLLCDENMQHGGVAALLLALLFSLLVTFLKSNLWRRICMILMIPVLYWIAGGVVALSVVLLLWYEWLKIRQNKMALSFFSFAAVLLVIVCPVVAKHFIVQYPMERLAWGADYVHFTSDSPFLIAYLWVLIVIVTVLSLLYFPEIKNKSVRRLMFPVQTIVFILTIYILIWKVAYPYYVPREDIMAYDYYCRMKQWDKIIQRANRKSPTVPMTVACLNLALYKTGRLPENMFNYFQNGSDGLLPSFQRDFMIPTVAGEPYYYLGFVNTAQRFAFEAMEALPDYQKSVRSFKRLAETNLINGHYKIAEKYLNFLENTLFYRKWAKETRSYLYNEDKINAHPEWGEIRRFQTQVDFLFSGTEKDMMLAVFFQQHRDNRMAYEYLLAYSLLTKNLHDFPVFFRLNKEFTYSVVPKSYQEAMIYIWGLSHNDLTDSVPFPVSNSIKQAVEAYARIYTSSQSPEPLLRQRFSKTYWYYLHFGKNSKSDQNTLYQY